MDVKEEHKVLLKELGLTDEDMDKFDGKLVRYEFHEEKGVRLYDPYYETSYNEYIGIDGWSAWSSEKDNFMSTILKRDEKTGQGPETTSSGPDPDKLSEDLQRRFGKAPDSTQGKK
jgi:hypothetical protein